MYSRDREAIYPIGLGVFVESIKGYWFVSTRQCRLRKREVAWFIPKQQSRNNRKENQTAAMLKSQFMVDWKALEWNSEPGDSYECPSFLTTEKAACAPYDMRAGWLAPKVIRWSAPSSERAGLVRRGYIYMMTPIRSFTVSGTTPTQLVLPPMFGFNVGWWRVNT